MSAELAQELKTTVWDFLWRHNPPQAQRTPKLLEDYRGREKDLLERLHGKYGERVRLSARLHDACFGGSSGLAQQEARSITTEASNIFAQRQSGGKSVVLFVVDLSEEFDGSLFDCVKRTREEFADFVIYSIVLRSDDSTRASTPSRILALQSLSEACDLVIMSTRRDQSVVLSFVNDVVTKPGFSFLDVAAEVVPEPDLNMVAVSQAAGFHEDVTAIDACCFGVPALDVGRIPVCHWSCPSSFSASSKPYVLASTSHIKDIIGTMLSQSQLGKSSSLRGGEAPAGGEEEGDFREYVLKTVLRGSAPGKIVFRGRETDVEAVVDAELSLQELHAKLLRLHGSSHMAS
jgi:hypothetical protein